jgi:hypothetical protein
MDAADIKTIGDARTIKNTYDPCILNLRGSAGNQFQLPQLRRTEYFHW